MSCRFSRCTIRSPGRGTFNPSECRDTCSVRQERGERTRSSVHPSRARSYKYITLDMRNYLTYRHYDRAAALLLLRRNISPRQSKNTCTCWSVTRHQAGVADGQDESTLRATCSASSDFFSSIDTPGRPMARTKFLSFRHRRDRRFFSPYIPLVARAESTARAPDSAVAIALPRVRLLFTAPVRRGIWVAD